MIAESSLKTFGYFFGKYPWRTTLMLVALFAAGLLESIGLISLLPLMSIALGDVGQAGGIVNQIVYGIFSVVNLQPGFGLLLALVVVAITLKSLITLLAMRQVGYSVAHAATELRLELLRALMQARWEYFVSRPAGTFANALSTEATRASMAYWSACGVLAVMFQVVIYICAALLVSWEVTLAGLMVGIAAAYLLAWLVRQARQAGATRTILLNSMLARFSDVLYGIKPLKAMAWEDRLTTMVEADTAELNTTQQREVMSKETLLAAQEPIVVLCLAIGIYLAFTYWQISLSTLIVMAILFHRIVTRIGRIQAVYQNMVLSESALWAMRETIDNARSETEGNRGDKQPSLESGILIDSASFSFGSKPVLSGATLWLPVRTFIAITGASGAGKTTLVDLLVGLHKPQQGRILVDGVELPDIGMKAWRRMIGYVPQETFLFHDSIFHNVTLGDPDLDRNDAESALRKAGAWEFVRELPAGMDSIVGERGAKLSGGQRQRIAIARAIVRNPKLLILDEATSGLDQETEQALLSTIRELSKSVMVIAISHNPAIARAADLVYQVENGNVISPVRGDQVARA
jgi:ATP-binding cassette subfamily C protein